MSALGSRALGVALGLLLDRTLGEPPTRWHPVARFGTAMQAVEGRLYADSRPRGVLHAAIGVGLGAGGGLLLRRTLGPTASTAAAVWIAGAGRMLRSTAADIERHLVADDLDGARAALPSLVGRDPSALDSSGVCAAVVESLAENTVDAVVAPALWGLVGGAPGALAHRATNTMDAMVGHRSPRHLRYGWASARLDDGMAWVPARALAALVAALAPSRAAEVARLVRRDAPAHPSPNAGVAETAVAAALGVELGGPLSYAGRVEDRPRLGDGPRPVPADVNRARRLVDHAELALVGACLAVAATDALLTRRPRRTAP
ncbi:CobD/CbiB family cobalamin biosynthesis protein [Ornithinimicrobium humiphilum]|uniref:CobD/CbiB family cobalamin biosynthesis protein n=1 Tax=Ornithinimicrobium humiphilum TaxID=125288 RepID=UPI00114FDCCD|nr:CobD/CbiB family cobalamin biosynthesis protein [Ornithinimicrobium humiphilum]